MTADLSGPHILVTGLPGSGKSTLARALAGELRLPILARDELLNRLLDELGIQRGNESVRARVQLAVSRLQVYLLTNMPSMVGDCGWWTNRHEPELLATGRSFIQVFCACPLEVARERTRARDRWDSAVLDDNYERFQALAEPLRLPGPLIIANTELPLDVALVASDVRSAMG